MNTIILDMGSGNTCKNDKTIIRSMIEAVDEVDRGKHTIILKWQLFKDAPPNIPLTHESFVFAYGFAQGMGFKTTASVFDKESMKYLLEFRIPFVKIACRPELYGLAKYSTVPVYISTADGAVEVPCARKMACVAKYPATLRDYEEHFTKDELDCVSDHTDGWGLYKKYKPSIIEKHFVLSREAGNPDSGMFAVTPDQLREIM